MASKALSKRSSPARSGQGFYLSARDSLFKQGWPSLRLTPRQLKSFAGGTEISIAAARNGHDAFQIFLAAPNKALKDVSLRRTALVDNTTGEKIDPQHINLFIAESVKARGVKPELYYPDILWPYKRFDIPKGQCQPIWVSVYVPKDTKAGQYRGTIEVCPAGVLPQSIQVNLTVWDFNLPDKTHLATVFGFSTMDSMSRFYDFYPGPPRKQAAMVRKYLRFLHDHRINALFYGYITTRDPRIVSIKEDKNGRLSYDFRKLDPYLELLVSLGMRFNIFAPPFWHNAEAMFKLNPLLKERFGHLGQKVFDSPEFDRAVADLLESYVKHLRRKGWIKNAFCYIWDEPPQEMYPHMRRMCEMVKRIAPDVPRLTVANYAPFDLEGYSDIWCPNLGDARSNRGCYDQYKEFYEKRKRAGDEVWWYLAVEPHPYPLWDLDYPLVDCRITGWLTWRYGLDGLAYWNVSAWHYNTRPGRKYEGNYSDDPSKRWPNKPWDSTHISSVLGKSTFCPGCGQLVYPGPDGPLSSTRLEIITAGIEDYEYLRLLDKQIAALSKKRRTPARERMLRAGERVLSAARRAANRADDWQRDGEKLLALRKKVGKTIEQLMLA